MPADGIQRQLHVAPTPFFSDRGCHIRISGLVRAMNALGTANRVSTYSLGRDVPDVDTVRCLRVPGYTKTSAGPSVFKIFADLFLLGTVIRQIRRFRPDFLHCHLHEGVLIGWLAKYVALRPGLVIGFDVQGGLVSELASYGHLQNGLLRRLVRIIESFVIARADLYFCSSKASRQLFLAEYAVKPDRLFLVPDGTDVMMDDAKTATAPSRPVAIYTGGLSESKGLSMLQDIIKDASDRRLQLDFVIVGYPTDGLQSFLDSNNISNCTLAGRIPFEELAHYLRRATVCMEPKGGETSEASGKLLNYMAAALPVVCFDTPNNREILEDYGYFASQPTASAFVDQLQAVIDDAQTAIARGRSGSAVVASRFSWETSARKIVTEYQDHLSN